MAFYLSSVAGGPRARKFLCLSYQIKLTISRWTKLANKKGDEFDKVISRLREVRLPESAMKYAGLEQKLVQHKVRLLLGEVEHISL